MLEEKGLNAVSLYFYGLYVNNNNNNICKDVVDFFFFLNSAAHLSSEPTTGSHCELCCSKVGGQYSVCVCVCVLECVCVRVYFG